MRHLADLLAAIAVATLVAAVINGRRRHWAFALNPVPPAATGRPLEQPPATGRRDLLRSAPAAADRYLNRSRSRDNRRPNSYGPAD